MIKINEIVEVSDLITREDKQDVIDALNLTHDEVSKLNMINCNMTKINESKIEMRFMLNSICKLFTFSITTDAKQQVKITVGDIRRNNYYIKLKNSDMNCAIGICKAIIFNMNKNLLLETQNNIL